MKHIINVTPNGKIEFLYSKDLPKGIRNGSTKRRASWVEPVNSWLRFLFHLIRRRVSDDSLLAGFTRRWPVRWQSNLAPSSGPVLGPFARRQDAIDAEIEWLNEHRMKGRWR